ncbi:MULTISPECIES: flagellar brake protein [unclassified Pseudoxanthomonas]|uniref:flagellar brake protein n=1 Tax=unclassified Pseudoxanthomonas TaxID=2645906 RepID=UPI00307725B9
MSENNDSIQLQPARYDEEEKYLLRTAREIGLVLQSLIDKRALISAYISPRNHTFPTALISVSPDEGSLLIDGSANDAINRGVTHAHHLTCVSQLDRIHVQFRLTGLSPILFEGQVAFRADIPDRVLKLQRREFYRLQVPVAEPVTCSIPAPQSRTGPEFTDLRVLDISGGGIAVVVPQGHPLFKPYRDLDDCLLRLPDVDPIPMQLSVRNLFRQLNQNGTETWRAGCQFTSLPRGADVLIQRYIFRLDRQRSARERGVG